MALRLSILIAYAEANFPHTHTKYNFVNSMLSTTFTSMTAEAESSSSSLTWKHVERSDIHVAASTRRHVAKRIQSLVAKKAW